MGEQIRERWNKEEREHDKEEEEEEEEKSKEDGGRNSPSSTLLTSEICVGWRERGRELTRRITDRCQHSAF